MPRPEKVQAVAEIKERLERARAVFLAEYAGLSVKEQQSLRRGLRDAEAEFKVVKMTLARRAAAELDIAALDELLLGPTGLAFADGDPVGAARVLKKFSTDHEPFSIKGGLLAGEYLTPERISDLADIEPREVLLAKMAGAMKAPMTKLAGLMAAMPRNLASMMQQLIDKKEEAGDTSGAAAQADEAAADEGPAEETTAKETTAEEASADAAAADEAPADESLADEALADEALADEEEAAAPETVPEDAADTAEDTESDDEPAAEAEEE
ncbi:MAG: 50S ribosomal protein L10 [Acidimicrobiia bacterium]|jgi:large subunit ribosomal protein L10